MRDLFGSVVMGSLPMLGPLISSFHLLFLPLVSLLMSMTIQEIVKV